MFIPDIFVPLLESAVLLLVACSVFFDAFFPPHREHDSHHYAMVRVTQSHHSDDGALLPIPSWAADATRWLSILTIAVSVRGSSLINP